MKFDKKYPDTTQFVTQANDSIRKCYQDCYCHCVICGGKTNWVSSIYMKPVCSEGCLDSLKGTVQHLCQRTSCVGCLDAGTCDRFDETDRICLHGSSLRGIRTPPLVDNDTQPTHLNPISKNEDGNFPDKLIEDILYGSVGRNIGDVLSSDFFDFEVELDPLYGLTANQYEVIDGCFVYFLTEKTKKFKEAVEREVLSCELPTTGLYAVVGEWEEIDPPIVRYYDKFMIDDHCIYWGLTPFEYFSIMVPQIIKIERG